MSRSFSVVTICKILIFQSTHPLTNCQNCVLLNMRNFAIISLLPPFLSLCPFVTQRSVVRYTFGGLLDHAEGMTDLKMNLGDGRSEVVEREAPHLQVNCAFTKGFTCFFLLFTQTFFYGWRILKYELQSIMYE